MKLFWFWKTDRSALLTILAEDFDDALLQIVEQFHLTDTLEALRIWGTPEHTTELNVKSSVIATCRIVEGTIHPRFIDPPCAR